MNCGGIILCGGRSSRMGIPKATLPFGPELMLTRVVRILRQVVQPVVVVAAPGQPLPDLDEEVSVVYDRQEGRGPLEGLAVGLAAIGTRADAAYLTSCDVPLLLPAFVERMIALLGEYDIVVPKDGTYHHPLAAVYRTAVLDHVQRLLDANRMRPVFLLVETKAREVPVDELRAVDPQLSSLENLNCPADYLSALKRAGFTAPKEIASPWEGPSTDQK